MSVYGFIWFMMVRVVCEVVLGVGVIVIMIIVGVMDEFDLEDFYENCFNIILLVGGVDDGEKCIVVENVKVIVFV